MKEQERKEKERKKNALNLDDDVDYSIINDDQIEELERQRHEGVALVDLKKIRYRGKFHEKNLSTCPILPRFHASYGEPSEVGPNF